MARVFTNRKSGLVLRGGSMRRQTRWLQSGPIQVSVADSTVTLLTTLSAAGLALVPFTIVRTRGLLVLRSDQAAAAEDQWISYGQIVVSEQAASIGVTAIPTPITDGESDLFFVYEMLGNFFRFLSAVGIDGAPAQRTFDSKAMRKVGEGENAVSVMEVPAAPVSGGVVLAVAFRQLIKLH